VDEQTWRYGMHDLARESARAHLDGVEYPWWGSPLARLAARLLPRLREGYLARYRFAAYCAALLSRADNLYVAGGESMMEGLRLFDAEAVNIRAGQAWAARRAADDIDAATVATMYVTRHTSALLTLRLEASDRLAWAITAIEASRDKDVEAEVRAQLVAGVACRHLGRIRDAISHWERRRALEQGFRSSLTSGGTLTGLADAYDDLGEHRRAIELYEQALAVERQIGDRWGEGSTLGNLGTAHHALGDYRLAIESYEQGLTIQREVGYRRGEGTVLGNLGSAYRALGEHRRAIELYERALAIRREVGDRRGEGNTSRNVADVLLQVGEAERARDVAEYAIDIAVEIRDERAVAIGQWHLGRALWLLGQQAGGRLQLERALVTFRRLGDETRAKEAREKLTEWAAADSTGDDEGSQQR
jgi:tetratricopeptide (TPR) repeat protein